MDVGGKGGKGGWGGGGGGGCTCLVSSFCTGSSRILSCSSLCALPRGRNASLRTSAPIGGPFSCS